jgi:DNA-binding NtrC family response regulator
MNPKTILIVDDEDMVRDIGRRMVERIGHSVRLAANGEEALAVLEKSKPPVDLVVFDMRMPGLSGMALLTRMKALSPASRFILSSGFALDTDASAIMAAGCCGFMQKPFQVADFAKAIHTALGL